MRTYLLVLTVLLQLLILWQLRYQPSGLVVRPSPVERRCGVSLERQDPLRELGQRLGAMARSLDHDIEEMTRLTRHNADLIRREQRLGQEAVRQGARILQEFEALRFSGVSYQRQDLARVQAEAGLRVILSELEKGLERLQEAAKHPPEPPFLRAFFRD